MKDLKDLYNKNYKTLLKEIKEDIINGNTSQFMDWKPILLRCQYYPKQSTDLMKNPNDFFWEVEKPILKFIRNLKGPPNSQNNLEKDK